MVEPDVSDLRVKGKSKSGEASIGASLIACLSLSKACWASMD